MRDMISVASGFQYSVNIGYDLGSDDKLRNFIPTKSALRLLEEILLSINPASTDRARVLIGAYGKGKSHIVLSILSVLLKRDFTLFEKMIPKIQENPRLYQLVQNYYESENKILPVVISGSNTSLTQAFLLALQRTLSEHGLLSAMPDTNYRAAISVIYRWEKEFPETFAKFQGVIDEPVSVLIERLENYDVLAYETFERIYPTLTAGSIFNPFLGFDVVELYESVAKSLKPMGYTGLYVVYDEFSKFLEANIVNASVSDTKMLQDFAEKCCRSGALQLHLMLISHKEISNYIDKLPKEKTDGWRGVSERFKHIHLNNNFIHHRIGRTGRAGRDGTAISFCCIDEVKQLGQVEKLIGKRLPLKESEWPMEITTPSEPKPRQPRPAKLTMQGNAAPERKANRPMSAKPAKLAASAPIREVSVEKRAAKSAPREMQVIRREHQQNPVPRFGPASGQRAARSGQPVVIGRDGKMRLGGTPVRVESAPASKPVARTNASGAKKNAGQPVRRVNRSRGRNGER